MKEYIKNNRKYIISYFKRNYKQEIRIIEINSHIEINNIEDRFFRFSIFIGKNNYVINGSEHSRGEKYLSELEKLYRTSKIKEILC